MPRWFNIPRLVIVAKWATTRFGFAPAEFGFAATTGTFATDFALAARGVRQEPFGKPRMHYSSVLPRHVMSWSSIHDKSISTGRLS